MDASGNTDVAVRASAALRRASGRDRDEWFSLLDEWGTGGRKYREIADWLTSQGLSDWWAQKLIVEYEQARGLRSAGVRRDGTFAAGASKTINAPVAQVFDAFTHASQRQQWLRDVEIVVRMSRQNQSARFDCADATRLNVEFAAKAGGKTQVAVEQVQLPDAAAAAAAKQAWRERLSVLKEILEAPALA